MAATSAVRYWTSRHEEAAATAPKVDVARPMPSGHPVSMMLMAVEISLPTNHSAVIFARTRVRSTPPAPLTSRPAPPIHRE
jgi:hypothetical protein